MPHLSPDEYRDSYVVLVYVPFDPSYIFISDSIYNLNCECYIIDVNLGVFDEIPITYYTNNLGSQGLQFEDYITLDNSYE